jgi:hypothetical protein
MNKGTISFVALLVAVALRVIHKFRVSVAQTAPLGYEDESGFHFGVPSFHK